MNLIFLMKPEFVGEQSDVTKYYKQAELLVHTSETEGLGWY